MTTYPYTDKDIAAKALILLSDELAKERKEDADFVAWAWEQAEAELKLEDEQNYRDLDAIQQDINDARRKGSLPASLVDRLMEAARSYQADLIKAVGEHEKQLRTRQKAIR